MRVTKINPVSLKNAAQHARIGRGASATGNAVEIEASNDAMNVSYTFGASMASAFLWDEKTNTRVWSIPATDATPTARGIMSASDKTKLNGIGTWYSVSKSVNVAASTIDNWVKGATQTVSAGTWIITAGAHFPASSTSSGRNLGCCIYAGTTNWEQQRIYSSVNAWTSLTPSIVLQLTGSTEISVRVGASTAANNVNTLLRIARIA